MTIARKLWGALVALTAPLWFIPAVIRRGFGYARWDIRYFAKELGADLRDLFRVLRDELRYAWSDEALALKVNTANYVAFPGKAASKATGSFIRTQVLTRLFAVVLILFAPVLLLALAVAVLIEEDFFSYIPEYFSDCFDVLLTGKRS